MNAPDVSVVMGVFNGAASLASTLDSVLEQQGCNFEFIVVDDGSTDATPSLLDAAAARDARLRVIHQANTGLTRALVRGCGEARGDFIARQDCGDRSLPGRLQSQLRFLREHPGVVMTACAVRYVGPRDEPLYSISCEGPRLGQGLAVLDVRRVRGPPHHGAAMMARSAYLQAGGYRPSFVVAQDIDLWLRLWELGLCEGQDVVGYEARLEAASIGALRRNEQLRYAALAVECARRRRNGGDERELLAVPVPVRPGTRAGPSRLERARFLHFIGSCLHRTDPAAARDYYWRAFREHPFMVKSLVRMAGAKG